MRPQGAGKAGGVSPVLIILWANVAVYVLQHFFYVWTTTVVDPATGATVSRQLDGAVSWAGLKAGKVYLLITSMFVHEGIIHILGNMLIVYFFGKAAFGVFRTEEFSRGLFCGGDIRSALAVGGESGHLVDRRVGRGLCVGVCLCDDFAANGDCGGLVFRGADPVEDEVSRIWVGDRLVDFGVVEEHTGNFCRIRSPSALWGLRGGLVLRESVRIRRAAFAIFRIESSPWGAGSEWSSGGSGAFFQAASAVSGDEGSGCDAWRASGGRVEGGDGPGIGQDQSRGVSEFD